ncbi:MAG TPA: hypothetical protein VK988_00745, partial [Acidimicrobiales bacterium]|nr:hypothetical protein [Acidimicrobiales bacterium]
MREVATRRSVIASPGGRTALRRWLLGGFMCFSNPSVEPLGHCAGGYAQVTEELVLVSRGVYRRRDNAHLSVPTDLYAPTELFLVLHVGKRLAIWIAQCPVLEPLTTGLDLHETWESAEDVRVTIFGTQPTQSFPPVSLLLGMVVDIDFDQIREADVAERKLAVPGLNDGEVCRCVHYAVAG